MVDTYSNEVVKEFVLQRMRLTPDTLGRSIEDVPFVIKSIGGLQYGGHKIELLNRFENFKSEWFDYWYENFAIIEGHVLRGALRIVNVEDYPYYFKATRSVARKRKYQNCPLSLSDNHLIALNFIHKNGPFTPSEFKASFSTKYDQLKCIASKLFSDLYNFGKIVRMGRKSQKPLYHVTEKLPFKIDMATMSEKEAKEWLFLRCLSIYGPFTVEDIAHWVGWNLTETKEILNGLLERNKVISVNIEGSQDNHYAKVEDLAILNTLGNNLREYSFVRVLFNDDALLLGYYRQLKNRFGYDWKYPQFSEGIVWRAAILYGRNLIGEAIVDMPTNSQFFKLRKLLIRKEFATSEIIFRAKNEFRRHATFHEKILEMMDTKFVQEI